MAADCFGLLKKADLYVLGASVEISNIRVAKSSHSTDGETSWQLRSEAVKSV
jgi:hypothetical protein